MYFKHIYSTPLMNASEDSIDKIESSTKGFLNSTHNDVVNNTMLLDNNTVDLILPCPVTKKGMLFADTLELQY